MHNNKKRSKNPPFKHTVFPRVRARLPLNWRFCYDKETADALIQDIKPSETPFFSAVRKDNPAQNAAVAKAWTNHWTTRYKNLNPPIFTHKARSRKKIKIAYTSEGFREFPTTHNISGVFENHDRKRFELYLYSYGSDDKSIYRKRLMKTADVFRDIKHLSLMDKARVIYKDKIDILVDLKGHTRGSRFEFMYSRPAPIQVEWLGFVGTTQADFIDYFIADKTVLPPPLANKFSEKIIYMPNTYWPTDDKLPISDIKYKKTDFGIKENALVFASFNQPYKIEPEIFDVWMRILKSVPNSILWQWSGYRARKNILKEARKRGVAKERIVFAKDLPKSDHLARLKLADIGLDTTICNGHTTTTDALWSGVPVITTMGQHFASRVSASMLKAVGLPELITRDTKEYEQLAIKLANNPEKLTALRSKLSANLKTEPLFDTKKLTKHLEKAYEIAYKNFNKGKAPKKIEIK